MPWSVADVEGFKKGLSEKQKRQWVEIANGVLSRGGSEKSAIMQASGAVREADSVSIADELRTEMFHARQVREAGDDHPYGPWAGGSKASGGRPSGGGSPSPVPEHIKVGRDVHVADRDIFIHSKMYRPEPGTKALVTSISPKAETAFVSFPRWSLRDSAGTRNDYEVSASLPFGSLREAAGEDHFYGPWSGGSKGAGGRPGGGGAADKGKTAWERGEPSGPLSGRPSKELRQYQKGLRSGTDEYLSAVSSGNPAALEASGLFRGPVSGVPKHLNEKNFADRALKDLEANAPRNPYFQLPNGMRVEVSAAKEALRTADAATRQEIMAGVMTQFGAARAFAQKRQKALDDQVGQGLLLGHSQRPEFKALQQRQQALRHRIQNHALTADDIKVY